MIDVDDFDGLLRNLVHHDVRLASYLPDARSRHFSPMTDIGELKEKVNRRPDACSDPCRLGLAVAFKQILANPDKIIERREREAYPHAFACRVNSAATAARASARASGVIQLAQKSSI